MNSSGNTHEGSIDTKEPIDTLKNILLISYHYHPDLEIGAQRAVKFAKYLPQFGWRPHILSVHTRYYSHRDNAPLGFDSAVYRTFKLPTPDDLYRSLKRLFLSMRSNQQATSLASASKESAASNPHVVHSSWLKRLLYSLSTTPDSSIGWYIPAVVKALRITQQQKFDFIYSSGPPQTCHLVGLTLSRLTGIPWLADFRDPWVFPGSRYDMSLPISEHFDSRFERETVRQASLVVTNTDEWKDHLIQKYHPWLDQKCSTILNGFDEEDFPATSHSRDRKDSRTIAFLHAGTLYGGRDPSALLTAAGELLTEGFIAAEEVDFRFYGNNDIDMTGINAIISEYSLSNLVSFEAPVNRAAYLDLIRNVEVLVLFQSAAANVHIPAKAFEYLATGNRILVLTSDGATKNMMSQFKQVSIAEIDNKVSIKSALRITLESLRSSDREVQRDPKLDSMTKRRQTQCLAGLLDRIVERGVTAD